MRRPFGSGRAEDNENKFNLTPMYDVVFIMLIFFIVTATFVKEVGLDVNQPDDDKPTVIALREIAAGNVTLENIDSFNFDALEEEFSEQLQSDED